MRSIGKKVQVLSAATPEVRPTAEVSGYEVEEVRRAALAVVENIPGSGLEVRSGENRVTARGRMGVCGKHVSCGESAGSPANRIGTPWTTIEARFRARGEDTAMAVEVDYETYAHCEARATCAPALLASTGELEREIIDRVRARLRERS